MGSGEIPFKRIALARLSPVYHAVLRPRVFASLERFCLFIGHGRSGSTLVGALLNAHPEVVLSNELDIVSYLDMVKNRRQLFGLIYIMSRRQVRHGSPGGGGYYYAVPNQWQGAHRAIRILGDRRAGSTAIQLFRKPELIQKLQDLVQVPVTFICVLRNPFDTIATTVRKTVRNPGESPDSHLRRQIVHYFERCEAILRVQKRLGHDSVKFVYHEDLIADPQPVLSELCHALHLEADASYLSDCAGVLQSNPHVTRRSIHWDSQSVRLVEDKIKAIPWLSRYSYY